MQTRQRRTVFQYKFILYAVTVCLYDSLENENDNKYVFDRHETYIVDAPDETAAEALGYAYMLQSYDLDDNVVRHLYRCHITVKQLAYMNGKFHEVITVDNLGD